MTADNRYEIELINPRILYVDSAATIQEARRKAQSVWIKYCVGLPDIFDRQTKQYVEAINSGLRT